MGTYGVLSKRIYVIGMLICLHYVLITVLPENHLSFLVAANVVQLIAPAMGMAWLAQSWRDTSFRHEKRFLTLLMLGLFSYLLTQSIWTYYELILHTNPNQKAIYTVLSALQIIFFLQALLYKILITSKVWSKTKILFDTFIGVVVCASVGWELLIKPSLTVFRDSTWKEIILSLSLPVGDFSLIILALILTSFQDKLLPISISTLLPLGIIAKVTGDALYVLQTHAGTYGTGSLSDPIWALGFLLIGTAGMEKDGSGTRHPPAIRGMLDIARFGLPYMGIVLLLVMLLAQTKLSGTAVSLVVSVLLIVSRQVLSLKQNEKLVKSLDWKVKDRTKRLEYLAFYDTITQLPNRRYFEREVSAAIERAAERGYKVAILFIDLDRFKHVNDTMGHHAGDMLLRAVAQRLQLCLPENGVLARQGGDEFAVFLEDTALVDVEKLAAKLLGALRTSIEIGETFSTTASIGASMYPDFGTTAEELMKQADMAMYQAKDAGKNDYRVYDQILETRTRRRMQLEKGLKQVMGKEQFFLVYQPQIHLETKKMIGMEVLLRWEHPEMGLVSPAEFIPVAEELRMIPGIGEWVLRKACEQMQIWNREGYTGVVSVNISPIQFEQEDFVDRVQRTLEDIGLNPSLLCLEITEGVAVQQIGQVIQKLEQLKNLGVKISIDDFGTGFSSLNYLHKFPIHALKIDRSFVQSLDAGNASIVSTILGMGRTLQVEVVAEGIETMEQSDMLWELGCRIGQGFYFGKPLSLSEFEKLLRDKGL